MTVKKVFYYKSITMFLKDFL